MPDAAWGAIGTIFGGVLLALVNAWNAARKEKFDEGYTIRQDQRQDIKEMKEEMAQMRKEMKELREEADKWRDKYDEVVELKEALESKCGELQDKYDGVVEELNEFKKHQEEVNASQKQLNQISNEVHEATVDTK